jgi:hypothetical protein
MGKGRGPVGRLFTCLTLGTAQDLANERQRRSAEREAWSAAQGNPDVRRELQADRRARRQQRRIDEGQKPKKRGMAKIVDMASVRTASPVSVP